MKVATKINKHNLEESYEDFPPEKNHTKFCKFLIGANKYSSNLACKSEALALSATLLSIKNWMHINDDEILKAQYFTFQSLINGDEIKSSYGEQIKTFLKIIGYDHVWQYKGTFSKRSLINAVE